MTYNRRSFLQTSFFLGTSAISLFPKQKARAGDFLANELFSQGPIDLLNKYEGTTEFGGDQEMAGHEIFWDKDGFIRKFGPIPPASKTYDVIVIGGGVSGLISTYFHKDQNTLLIEGSPQMGGNSKATQFQNLSMSSGAAYINVPNENDPIDTFLKDLGIRNKFRTEPADDFTVGMNGVINHQFWNRNEEFRKVREKFVDIYENDYPELPDYPEHRDRKRLNDQDNLTFSQWVKNELGEINPEIREFFHQYCWSSFGGSPDELSAAQVIGFIASDLNGVMTLPGGNATIADAIYRKLKNSRVSLLNNSFAMNVKNTGSGVEVTYFEDQKRLITVKAKKVIMACSKQVAKYLLVDLSKERNEAMKAIRYRAYLVANVLIDKKVTSPGYDLFALKGKVPTSEKKDIDDRGFCDIIFADWANFDRADQSALTLYIPQPYDGANQLLFSPFTYEKHQARILKNLLPWLPGLNLQQENIVGMRMSRYGHGLPLAKQGQIASGILEEAHAPIDDAIFFAHSDNWANPCFETAFYSSHAWT